MVKNELLKKCLLINKKLSPNQLKIDIKILAYLINSYRQATILEIHKSTLNVLNDLNLPSIAILEIYVEVKKCTKIIDELVKMWCEVHGKDPITTLKELEMMQ